ncbi:MAG: PKD domain-containing protein [Bacteroidia bacterium]|nr:PKD domain-containing protein [Bacteroidia bacterium]
MKPFKFYPVILLLQVSFFLNAQNKAALDAYKTESECYFSGLSVSEYGIVATDNYASRLYLIHDGVMEPLHSSAGCGRYYTLSPDRKKIGFKIITQDGKQIPAVLDILTKQATHLHNPENLCGQVSFSNNGMIAFTIGNFLHVVNGSSEQTFDIGLYSNITPISPDGNFIVFNNNEDRLILLNLLTNQIEQISDNQTGYIFPFWSPDGNKIVYSSISGNLFVYDKTVNTTYALGDGFNPSWSDDSRYILFTRTITDDFAFISSDIYITRFDGTGTMNLTNTPDIHEMGAVFHGNKLIYHTYNKREIFASEINTSRNGLTFRNLLFEHTQPLPVKTYNLSNSAKAETRVPGTVPYVNQVYDTPEWHYGYGSCAPSTAIMAIAYFNKVPQWPITTSNGVGNHTSYYGAYVADKYRLNEYYFQDVSSTGGGEDAWGGYGYMWGNGSPNSYMASYIQKHNLTSVHSTSTTFQNVTDEIDQGYPFPICNLLSTAGHLTLTIGYVVGQHTLIFNDPYGDKNHTSWPNWYGQDAYYDWPGYNNGYQNLNTMAWTVTSEGSEVTYNDTLIDDVFYNHGFYIYNQGVSLMRYFHDNNTGGYNSHFWWTYTSSSTTIDTCYVTWTPSIPENGNYEVFAYIPSSLATAASALYRVNYNGGSNTVSVNQASNPGQWVSLGTYSFVQGSTGYVRLGDAAGVQSQVIAFDAVKFSKVGPTDHIAPTTSVSSPGNWKTADFTATFNDQDNAGGSGVEKAYYQVLDFDGQYWGANTDHGFFADNFDVLNTAVWTSPASSGTWSSQNGNLFQSDSTVNNTNIFAPLNQNLSNRYLYHFTARMESAAYSTNQRRFGFHFFCDTGSTLNRSDSYFIFFRQETSRLEFYKVVNNSFTQELIVNNVVTNIGQWYDIKVIFDRITGKISVYRDDAFIGSWTDSSPLTTPGNYVSFRTGHSKVLFGELKVYRSRYTSANVTVGTPASDIRYQNPNFSTFGAKIKSIVADSAGNLSAIAYHDLNVDWTPPLVFVVSDGTGIDMDTTTDNIHLSANWTASSDTNSALSEYKFAIGTTPGGTDITNWTSNGLNTSVTVGSLSLDYDSVYYLSVKAINGAGLETIVSSDGILVLSPVAAPVASFSNSSSSICEGSFISFTNTSANAATYLWTFQGGVPATSTDINPTVQYYASGVYNIQLIASGPGGTDTLNQTINVQINLLPVAGFTVNANSGNVPFLVLFTNTSQYAGSYQWNFGDGATSTSSSPYHTFNNAGDYTVVMIAHNNCGNDTAYMNIHVDQGSGVVENPSNLNIEIFPNPFIGKTVVNLTLFKTADIKMELFDMIGKAQQIIFNERAGEGRHKIIINSISSGSYVLRIQIGERIIFRKLIAY